MSIYTIRARQAGDVIIGEVLNGERVVATCSNGYTCDEQALAAAAEKRDRLEADWQKYLELIAKRKPREWWEEYSE